MWAIDYARGLHIKMLGYTPIPTICVVLVVQLRGLDA